AKDFGMTILTGVAKWVAGQVAKELAIMATAAAASAGLSEVLDVARRIYKAMVTAKRYAAQILGMINQSLDNVLLIANGAVDVVGAKIDKILHAGMPVVIGFLADQVGLGGITEAIRNVITGLRAKVDEAILWLIDKIRGAIMAVVGAAQNLASKLFNWVF